MSNCPTILQVWFDSGAYDPERRFDNSFPTEDGREHFGLPLWRPSHHPVFMWAIDYVVCGDTRWVLYGPFEDKEAARKAESKIAVDREFILGHRIINEHCAKHIDGLTRKGEFPRWAWTDG